MPLKVAGPAADAIDEELIATGNPSSAHASAASVWSAEYSKGLLTDESTMTRAMRVGFCTASTIRLMIRMPLPPMAEVMSGLSVY